MMARGKALEGVRGDGVAAGVHAARPSSQGALERPLEQGLQMARTRWMTGGGRERCSDAGQPPGKNPASRSQPWPLTPPQTLNPEPQP